MNKHKPSLENKGSVVIYEDKKGNVELRADIEHDTIWATQLQIANLFNVNVRTVNEHLQNIFRSKELREISVIRKFRITAQDSKVYSHKFYNLDVIIAVGYRVNSKKATKFRIWATGVLREYLKNGFALNHYRLDKTPEAIEGLHEAVAFMETKEHGERIKGKITFKLTKDFVEK